MTNYNIEIRDNFQTMKNIVLTITLLFDDIKYFKTSPENERKIASEYRFLWRIYSSLYINLILDFYKIFDDSESYSLKKLLNKIKNNIKRIKWASQPDILTIDSEINNIDKLLNSEIFKKVKTARNKYYAHLDPKRPPKIEIKLDELKSLLEFAQGIINQIYGWLEEKHQSFGFSDTDIGHYMIKDLYKYNLIRHEIYRNIEHDSETSINKIIDILRG